MPKATKASMAKAARAKGWMEGDITRYSRGGNVTKKEKLAKIKTLDKRIPKAKVKGSKAPVEGFLRNNKTITS